MLPMRRRFFTALSILSLVLCGATAVLWVRSYTYSHLLVIDLSPRVNITFASGNGGFYAHLWISREAGRVRSFHDVYPSRPDEYGGARRPTTADLNRFGFVADHWSSQQMKHAIWVVVPGWFVVATILVPLLVSFSRRRRGRQQDSGFPVEAVNAAVGAKRKWNRSAADGFW